MSQALNYESFINRNQRAPRVYVSAWETQRWVHHKFIQTHGATDECECGRLSSTPGQWDQRHFSPFNTGPMTAAREWVENREPTWRAGPHGHVNNLSMQRRVLLSAIFNREGEKMDCYVVVVWLKPNQFSSSSRGFTTVLLLNSAFCVIHTCRGNMKRNWDLLFTYLLWLRCPQDIYIDKGQVPCPCC